jgi:hypothetical protein
MRERRPSLLPVLRLASLGLVATLAACAHTRPASDQRAAWLAGAPAPVAVAGDAALKKKCRRTTPLGSNVPRVVCTTALEDEMRQQADRDRVDASLVVPAR